MRADRSPWVKDITEAVIDPRYPEVIAIQGSQTAKTDGVLLNSIGRQLHYRHKPVLLYEPVEALADAVSDRIQKMFASVPELWAGLDQRRKSKHEMFINSVRLGIGWGGSTSQTASHPAELILFDELDRCRDNSEGNPWQQTKARRATYPLGTHVGASSPTYGIIEEYRHPDTGLIHWKYQDITEKVLSLSWQLWQEGTRGEFMLPCPDCDTFFAPKLTLLLDAVPENATPEQAYKQASLACPHCGSLIDQRHQYSMIQKGKMICPGQTVINGELIGERPDTRIYSAHVNGLCSPWEPWANRAFELVRVLKAGDKGRIKVVYNTEFGQCYGDAGEAPKWELVKELAGGYRMRSVLPFVKQLVMTVDVQRNRLVMTVWGIGKVQDELEFALVDYKELWGNTAQKEVWDELWHFAYKEEYGDGGKIVTAGAVDTGYNPSRLSSQDPDRNIIYEFCTTNKKFRAVKSSSHKMSMPYKMSRVQVDKSGRVKARGLKLWQVDSVEYKTRIYTRLGWRTDKPGRWHFPSDTPDQFFQQLTNEQQMEDGSFVRVGENHVLDCTMLAMFLVDLLNLKALLTPYSAEPKSHQVEPERIDLPDERPPTVQPQRGRRIVRRT